MTAAGGGDEPRRWPLDVVPAADERTMLLGFLDRQRALVHWKLDGLSDEAARSVGTPTGLTVHGLVRHLEHVERWWFRDRFAGETDLPYAWTDDDPDGELKVPADVRLVDLLSAYAEECRRSDEVIARSSLEDRSVHRGKTLRWIVHHMTEETARHLGHLDLLCELADGRVGEEPDGLDT